MIFVLKQRSVNSNMILVTLMYLKQMRLKRILMRVTSKVVDLSSAAYARVDHFQVRHQMNHLKLEK
jgi:hypothetical protein